MTACLFELPDGLGHAFGDQVRCIRDEVSYILQGGLGNDDANVLLNGLLELIQGH